MEYGKLENIVFFFVGVWKWVRKWEVFCISMENWRILWEVFLWEYGNGCASGRVFPQEVVRHLFPRPRDPSEWSAGQGRGGGAKKILENKRRRSFHIHPTQKRQVMEKRHKNFMPLQTKIPSCLQKRTINGKSKNDYLQPKGVGQKGG